MPLNMVLVAYISYFDTRFDIVRSASRTQYQYPMELEDKCRVMNVIMDERLQ